MKNVDYDSKVCDKDKDGNLTAKNQAGSTLAEIMESEDKDVPNSNN